jgi:hypothetical protein
MTRLILLPVICLALAVGLAGTAFAQPTFQGGAFHADPTGGPLADSWRRGAALEFDFILTGTPDQYLTLDLGWEFFASQQDRSLDPVHGLRAMVSQHVVIRSLGRAGLFLGVGWQSFIVDNRQDLPLYSLPGEAVSRTIIPSGRGPTAKAGVSLPIWWGQGHQLSLLGSWNYTHIQSEGNTYLLLGVAVSTGGR